MTLDSMFCKARAYELAQKHSENYYLHNIKVIIQLQHCHVMTIKSLYNIYLLLKIQQMNFAIFVATIVIQDQNAQLVK